MKTSHAARLATLTFLGLAACSAGTYEATETQGDALSVGTLNHPVPGGGIILHIPTPGALRAIAGIRRSTGKFTTLVGMAGGILRNIAWHPLLPTGVADVPGDFGAFVSISGYANSASTDFAVVAENNGEISEITLPTSSVNALGAFGNVVAVTGYEMNGARTIVYVTSNGDVRWLDPVTHGTGFIANQPGVRFLASYVTPKDNQPRIILGTPTGDLWKVEDISNPPPQFDYLGRIGPMVALAAHVTTNDSVGHLFVGTDTGDIRTFDIDEWAGTRSAPSSLAQVSGGIVSLSSFLEGVGTREHVLVATQDGTLRWISADFGSPTDNLVLDRFDKYAATDDRLCLPGGDDYAYVNLFQLFNNASPFLVLPATVPFDWNVSHGGPAQTGTVTFDGASLPQAFGPYGQASWGSSELKMTTTLGHTLSTSGPCGTVTRSIQLHPTAPSPPVVNGFTVTPRDGDDQHAYFYVGGEATFNWNVNLPRQACTHYTLQVTGNNYAKDVFAYTEHGIFQGNGASGLSLTGHAKYIPKDTQTKYAFTVTCNDSGLSAAGPVVYVNLAAASTPPSCAMQYFEIESPQRCFTEEACVPNGVDVMATLRAQNPNAVVQEIDASDVTTACEP